MEERDEQIPVTQWAIETRGLRKVYGDRVALEDLTITVGYGEVFGFLGPNGAGKTTAVKMLVGLIRPTAGDGRVLGYPLGDHRARRQIGYLPELFRFHDWLTGEELLDLHGQLYGLSRAERRRRIPEVLELVGLTEAARRRVRTYSKGMQQRIGIAQALLAAPRLVILDEPTSALDPLGRRDVRDLIRRLRAEGVTVFLNSHLLSEVEAVCDRVAFVNHGRVIAIGPLEELLRGELVVEFRLGALPDGALASLERIVQVEDVRSGERPVLVARAPDEAAIARAVDLLVAAGVPVFGVIPERRSLEDLFVRLIEDRGQPPA
ncbi:ABC transporter ATP-binding protein [Thermomicrobium sp. 4228-Ro]|uniref:ABC transporter ATP-binding protein n=1 Tax=Thermomicrobium sp. 4228-Ro TaxID=2993937 RepID=UPI0022490E3C|nr:ABC transporter ATP-binding protein [Thermomicrobium sp. 4228-Ro]MCX2726705.1 ABC transporter ATP-binding protein [Thermomicrobium sp. 4228-Ro]